MSFKPDHRFLFGMPTKWPDSIYNYEQDRIAHEDLAAVDIEAGKWFLFKYCTNPRDPEGKFACRTPFSSEEIVSARAGHCQKKIHVSASG